MIELTEKDKQEIVQAMLGKIKDGVVEDFPHFRKKEDDIVEYKTDTKCYQIDNRNYMLLLNEALDKACVDYMESHHLWCYLLNLTDQKPSLTYKAVEQDYLLTPEKNEVSIPVCVVRVESLLFFDKCERSYLPIMHEIFGVFKSRSEAESAVWKSFGTDQYEPIFENLPDDVYSETFDDAFKYVDERYGGHAIYIFKYFDEYLR